MALTSAQQAAIKADILANPDLSAQLSKDSETMLKAISSLVPAIATLAESVKAMADENAKEDDPKRYDIKRDEAGRVQSITPVH